MWGNHSPTMFPDLFHAKVNGSHAADRVDMDWYEEEYIPRVAKRGAEIIEARGASRAASAANAAIDHVHDWVTGTRRPALDGVRSDGEYGVDEGLMSSLPRRCSGGAYEIVEGLEVGEFAPGPDRRDGRRAQRGARRGEAPGARSRSRPARVGAAGLRRLERVPAAALLADQPVLLRPGSTR